MAEFGSDANAMPELMYEASFGHMPNRTVYLDRLSGAFVPEQCIDRREDIKAEIKSLTTASNLFAIGTSYSGTTGSIPVLIPTVVDSQLYDLTIRKTPLASGLIPRATNAGLFADIVKRTAVSTAKWRAEAGALASEESTYTRTAQAMSYCYAVGQLSGPLMVASKVWQDALKYEMEGQYRSLKYLEENTIINGAPSATDVSGGVTDAKAFTGLATKITTNYKDMSNTKIVIQEIRDGIRKIQEAYGDPDLIVTDYKTLNDLKALMTDQIRFAGPVGLMKFGIADSIDIDGIPVIPDLFMPTTAASRELHILTVKLQNNIQLRVLQDATMEELAKTADTYKFMIKEYLTLIVVNEAWCHRIYGLA